MLMLIPSMYVGLIGIGLTAILLAADWYIWDSRYWISQQCAPELVQSIVANGKKAIHVPASGRELVATLAPPSPEPNALSLHQVQGGVEWMDHWL